MSRFLPAATLLSLPLLFTTTPAAIAQISAANDGTGTVVDQQGQAFDISGGSLSGDGSNLFHNFADFNLSASQIATFLSTPDLQNILSRISGGNPSYIDGLLQVSGGNANLFLLNPAGIVFGNNAQLNLAGDFTASTASGIGFGEEFWSGNTDYAALVGTPTGFAFTGNGAIINAGDLAVTPGRSLNLFASNVVNTGTLTAAGGNIQIMAVPGTNTLRLNQAGQILGLEFAAPTNNLAITDLPQLLTGSSLDTGLVVANGVVTLAADQTVISPNAGNTFVNGLVDVSGDLGGNVGIFGQAIALHDATINASGTNGGGEILVGGDYQGQGNLFRATTTTLNSNSVLDASAINTGNGGKIIVWADDTTQFSGTALATGGSQSGDGGLIETSGKVTLDLNGASVNAGATNGANGLWLIDPQDIVIAISAGTITPDTIESALDGGTNLTLTTNQAGGDVGDITLTDSINQTGNGTASLTLTGRLFDSVMGMSTITMTSTGGLTFNLNAVNPGTATAAQLGQSIQEAHDAIGAVAGARTINLGAGTFQRGSAIGLSKSLTLNGAGQGVTILDGGGGDRLLSTSTMSGDITVSNLTIQNGYIYGNGAGISNSNGTLNVVNTTISNNNADGVDGGGKGGGIYNDGGTVNLSNSTISNNDAEYSGGGIYSNGSVTLTDSTVSRNSASYGGGIDNFGTATLTNSTVSGNNVTGTYAAGGGILNANELTLTNSTVSGNNVTGGNYGAGGGIYNAGTTTLTNSTVSGNNVNGPTQSGGGGIFNAGGGMNTLNLINSTVSGNNALGANGLGGGIYNYGAAQIVNSTIANNSAFNSGGGIYNKAEMMTIGTVSLTNSIIANSPSGGDASGGGSFTFTGNNIVEDGSFVGSGILNVDPRLTTLGDYGGSTQTHFFDFSNGISPAIDGGNDSAVSGLTIDQRGGDRLVDTVDIGAVEFQGTTLALVSGDGQTTAANTAFAPIVVAAKETTFNTVLSGLTVNFKAPASGASTSPTSLSGVTDAAGQVTVTPTANGEGGMFALTAIAFKSGDGVPANLTITTEPVVTEPVADPPDCFPDCAESDPQESTDTAATEAETNIEEVRGTLKNIEEQTGIKPAIVYVYFPEDEGKSGVGNKDNGAKEKATKAVTQWEFKGDRLSDFLNAENRFLEPDRRIQKDTPLRLVMVTPEGQAIQYQVPGATYATVMKEAKNFMRGITNPQFGNVYLTPAQYLYDVLIRPLEKELNEKGIANIAFVMDEGLRALPIAALHDGEQFLIEKYSVGLMPSFSLTNTSAYVPPKNNQLIAMGASEFENANDLPSAPLEAQIIASDIWGGDVLLDSEFTVANLIAARERTPYGIVHLATHGEFLPGNQDSSYIQFQDQKVSLADLTALNLNDPPIELLVLSACRTALGDRQAELGFAGLALASGAKSALGSIWDVSDAGTMGLMTQFYKELRTSPIKAEALRLAQIAMLRGETSFNDNTLNTRGEDIFLPENNRRLQNQDLTHPYFWGSFTLVGNPW